MKHFVTETENGKEIVKHCCNFPFSLNPGTNNIIFSDYTAESNCKLEMEYDTTTEKFSEQV